MKLLLFLSLIKFISSQNPYFTDSVYLALSAETLDELVKPELREEWNTKKHQWFPRTDTQENAAFDRRTPGRFLLRLIQILKQILERSDSYYSWMFDNQVLSYPVYL